MKVGIFTPYPLNPGHPRTEMFFEFFRNRGIEVTMEQYNRRKGGFLSFLSKVLINIFDLSAVFALSKRVKEYDILLIQDLRYLPLAIFARRSGRRVVYETLDNSVYIRVYHQRTNLFYPLFKMLTNFYVVLEKKLADHYTEAVIVNSHALEDYFDKKATLIMYSSPFESTGIINCEQKSPAFIYLGAISEDKGIFDMIGLVKQYQLPAFLFGDCNDSEITSVLEQLPLLYWKPRMNSAQLMEVLKGLVERHFLTGLSLIKPVHYSYATQEANKEIDYLSMGIPFIGNHRATTKEKIDADCGIFLDDPQGITELFENKEIRRRKISSCLSYYKEFYSAEQFNRRVSVVFKLGGNG